MSFLVRNRRLLKEWEKENKSLVRLVLLLQVSFCRCSSLRLEKRNAAILKVSHFQVDLTWKLQKTIPALDNIIIPYFEVTREELGLPKDQKCLLIYDVFKAQTTDKYREHLDENNIAHVQVQPNLTHIFQPLDLNANSQFQEWYAKEVTNSLNSGENVHQIFIDTKLSKMKPIHARWLNSLYNKLWNSGKMIKSAYEKRNYLNYLNCNSYVVPFFFHFPCWIFFPLTIMS